MNNYVDSCRTLNILKMDSGLLAKPAPNWKTFVPTKGDIAYVDNEESEYGFDGVQWLKRPSQYEEYAFNGNEWEEVIPPESEEQPENPQEQVQ